MMQDDKVIELFESYARRAGPWFNRLDDERYVLPVPQYVTMHDRKAQVGHAAWMACEAIGFIKEAKAADAERAAIGRRFAESGTVMSSGNDGGLRRLSDAARSRREKAHRWLGFIQGVLWMAGAFTLEELKEHSRRCSDEPEKAETK